MSEANNILYFQYRKSRGLPIFVKFDGSTIDRHLITLISDIGFSEATSADFNNNKDENKRLLSIEVASAKIAGRIGQYSFEDQFGPESISPKVGYKFYRFKGLALMIYSLTHSNWELGVMNSFGSSSMEFETKVVINRYLSWALAPFGLIGFWGVPVDEGMVVMSQKDSNAEVVFVDTLNNMMLTVEGEKRMQFPFQILRLDKTLKGKNLGMSKEELMGFLSNRCTYFDYNGLNSLSRTMIRSLAQISNGIVYPFENFKPRSNLQYS